MTHQQGNWYAAANHLGTYALSYTHSPWVPLGRHRPDTRTRRCACSTPWGQSLHTKDGSKAKYLQVVEIKEQFSPHTVTLSSNLRQKEVRKCGF